MTQLDFDDLVEFAFQEKKNLMAEQIRLYQEEKMAKMDSSQDAFNSSVNDCLDSLEIALEGLNQKQISSETFITSQRLLAGCLSIQVNRAVMAY